MCDSAKSELVDFANNTTCHGIGSLVRSKVLVWQIIWTCALLGAFGVLVFQIVTLGNKFWSYPVNTKVEVRHSALPFPSVTICNLNPYRKHLVVSMSADPQIAGLRDAYIKLKMREDNMNQSSESGVQATAQPSKRQNFGTLAMPPIQRRTTNVLTRERRNSAAQNATPVEPFNMTTPILVRGMINIDYDLIEDNNAPKEEDRLMREAVQLEAHKIVQEATETYGHQAMDLIQLCRFLGEDCSHENFTRYVTYGFGNCYTFNSGELYPTPLQMGRSGAMYGLTLVLNVEKDEYLPVLSSGSGVRVVIHDHGSFPFPSQSGVSLPSGFETEIGITVRQLERMAAPYGDCYYGANFSSYDPQACKSACIHRKVIETCGCYTYYRFDEKKFLPQPEVPQCSNDNDTRCSITVFRDYAQQKFECQCRQLCHEVEYMTTSAMNQWPSQGYKAVLIDQICRRAKKLGIPLSTCNQMKGEDGSQFISDNFLAVTIYFKHLNYESIIQEPGYPLANFLSDIGGTMGLYAGISLLTGIEFITLFLTLLQIAFTQSNLRLRKQSSDIVKEVN